MAQDIYCDVEGIEGESTDSEYPGVINVLAFSWGMSQSGTTHLGKGGGAGKADIQDVSITKYIDKATPNLMQACMTGKHFPKVTLMVRKAGEKPLTYLKIEMEGVIITSVSTGGSGGEDRLTENVTFNFGKVGVFYVPQKDDGTGDAEMEVHYNIAENVAG